MGRPSRLAIAALLVLTGACADSAESGPATPTTAPYRLNPLTPTDPNRLPPAEAAAAAALADPPDAAEPHDHHGHAPAGPTTTAARPLDEPTRTQRFVQWEIARRAALDLATPAAATAAGYVRAAVPGAGVGTHWVKWSLVDEVFDPAAPEMLLFDERTGRTPQLVGLSYWVKTPIEPEGFAGPEDHWHQHAGLCVVNGWIDREQAPPSCPGTWLAGGDLWMLHAWVVPGWENRWGDFGSVHPDLCPSARAASDIARCDLFRDA